MVACLLASAWQKQLAVCREILVERDRQIQAEIALVRLELRNRSYYIHKLIISSVLCFLFLSHGWWSLAYSPISRLVAVVLSCRELGRLYENPMELWT